MISLRSPDLILPLYIFADEGSAKMNFKRDELIVRITNSIVDIKKLEDDIRATTGVVESIRTCRRVGGQNYENQFLT